MISIVNIISLSTSPGWAAFSPWPRTLSAKTRSTSPPHPANTTKENRQPPPRKRRPLTHPALALRQGGRQKERKGEKRLGGRMGREHKEGVRGRAATSVEGRGNHEGFEAIVAKNADAEDQCSHHHSACGPSSHSQYSENEMRKSRRVDSRLWTAKHPKAHSLAPSAQTDGRGGSLKASKSNSAKKRGYLLPCTWGIGWRWRRWQTRRDPRPAPAAAAPPSTGTCSPPSSRISAQ
eukprot:1703283-Rhodomonas_salina.1